jgi:hypothetical protein
MRGELARVKTERGILKKALGYFTADPSEVSFYCTASQYLADANDGPHSRRYFQRLSGRGGACPRAAKQLHQT